MSETLAQIILQRKGTLLTLIILVVMVLSYGMRYTTFTTDYQAFFDDANPQLLAYESIEDTYTQSDNILIVLAPKDGDVFTPSTLALVSELTDIAWQAPYSLRVDSITNFQHAVASEDELVVDDLIPDIAQLGAADLERVKGIALHEPDLVNKLISSSGHVAGINITIQLPGVHLSEGAETVAYVRKKVEELKENNPNVDIYLSGLAMLNNAFAEAAKNDLTTLMPIMYLVILILLMLLLRTVAGVVVTLVVIILSVMVSLGIAGWIGWTLTSPAVSAPTIILTIAVANCVHILVSYYAYMREGMAKQSAMLESLTVNIYPIFITGLTTVIGFLTLNFSEVPPYRVMGNMVALGVVAAMVLSLSVLPAIMVMLPGKVKQKTSASVPVFEDFADWVIKRKLFLLIFVGASAVILISMLPRNQLEDKFVESFSDDVPFRIASDFTGKNLTGVYSIEYSVVQGSPGGVSEPEFLQRVERFSDWLTSLPEVIHVSTVTDMFKRLNKNMHGDDDAWYRLPESRELAAQYLLLYELSLPFGLDLNHQINMDKSSTRIVVTFQDLSTEEMLQMEQRITQWWVENETTVAPMAASATLMFSHISQRNITSLLIGAVLGLLLISLTLIFALKSWRYGFISLIPNMVPAAMAFGIWGIFVGKVGMGLSVVVGMTLGVIVDDTVHFLTKYIRARRENGMSPEDAVRYAFSTVGVALAVTSFVLVVGFYLLSFSEYNRNADMGMMTAITIALALLIDFLLLPVLLLFFDRHDVNKRLI